MTPEKIRDGMTLHLPDIISQWERYRLAVPAARYRLTLGGWKYRGDNKIDLFAFVWPRKPRGQKEASPGTLADDVPVELKAVLRMHFAKNYDCYVTPLPTPEYFFLLVDDLAGEAGLNRFLDAGYCPSWIAETSPGNFQATLIFRRVPNGENIIIGNDQNHRE